MTASAARPLHSASFRITTPASPAIPTLSACFRKKSFATSVCASSCVRARLLHSLLTCATARTRRCCSATFPRKQAGSPFRSEEHTSELQSPCNLVCSLLLEKKKNAFLQFIEVQWWYFPLPGVGMTFYEHYTTAMFAATDAPSLPVFVD